MRTTPRPPLTKRLRPGHWVAIDCVIGGLSGLVVFVALHKVFTGQDFPSAEHGLLAVSSPGSQLAALAFGIGTAIVMALRRRRPGLMLGVLLTGLLLAGFLSGGNPQADTLFIPSGYVLFLVVATYRDREVLIRTLAMLAGAILLNALIATSADGPKASLRTVPFVLFLVVVWAIGYIVRQRRHYAVGLQVEAASKAVAEERLRIARELHDVVAHSMSVIAVQAGYGQYVIDSQPGDARTALDAIQATSREALDEMRRMLGALRQADDAVSEGAYGAPAPAEGAPPLGSADRAAALVPADASAPVLADDVALVAAREQVSDDGGGFARLLRQMMRLPDAESGVPAADPAATANVPLYPAPGLADLDRLISRTQGAGVEVRMAWHGARRDLPASIDLSAYRIIQESLTNVVKHAHARACDVLVSYGADELLLKVTDGGAGMPEPAMTGSAARHIARAALGGHVSGHGLTGMRERVSLLGGDFTAGPLPGYGFQVTARIPLPARRT